MARPIKQLDPCRQGLQSISLVSGSPSEHFVWFDYGPLDNAYGRPLAQKSGSLLLHAFKNIVTLLNFDLGLGEVAIRDRWIR